MPEETIVQILMRRDRISQQEAQQQVEEARKILHSYLEEGDTEAAFEVCHDYLGLEPDYLEELI